MVRHECAEALGAIAKVSFKDKHSPRIIVTVVVMVHNM